MKNLPRPLLTLASIAVMAWVPVGAVAREAAAAPPTYRVEVVGAGLQGFDMNASGVVSMPAR
jgi:hypothetical protein